ncbi:cold-shock protein [Rubrobacter tropicus]|uniref:Cold-shock protein n=1 Tax=Rubrobacter tropicus TaxID=2653851 RepID=A0A6G8QFL0_9ACTN|nr:cold-shock protein [Rubrobacter tropicus]
MGTAKEAGRLRWFDEEKGYGFIELPSGEDRFFHRSGLSCDPDELEPGLPLAFETRPGARGPFAVGVEPLKLRRPGDRPA